MTVRLLPKSFAKTDEPFSTTPDAVVPESPVSLGVTLNDTVAVVVCPVASVAV